MRVGSRSIKSCGCILASSTFWRCCRSCFHSLRLILNSVARDWDSTPYSGVLNNQSGLYKKRCPQYRYGLIDGDVRGSDSANTLQVSSNTMNSWNRWFYMFYSSLTYLWIGSDIIKTLISYWYAPKDSKLRFPPPQSQRTPSLSSRNLQCSWKNIQQRPLKSHNN